MTGKRRRLSKKPKKKTAAQAESQDWFDIRCILDERVIRGSINYLVDWEGLDKDTGGKHPPSWIQSKDVSRLAIEDWESEKARKAQQSQQAHLESQQDSQQQVASAEDSDISQPPRSAQRRRIPWSNALASKRRRTVSVASSSSASEPSDKVQRVDSAKLASEEPGLDLSSTSSNGTESEVYDLSYQHATDIPRAITVVELTRKRDFDPSEYLSVSDSQASSQSLAELETQDSQLALVPFSQGAIPDSQDPSDLSWSHPRIPKTPASRVIPNSFKTDSVPLTGAESTDIPSHQPDHLGDTIDVEGAELSHESPAIALVADPTSRLSASPGRVSQDSTQPTASCRYLTQPDIPYSFPLPASSVNAQGVSSTNHLISESTYPREEEIQPLSISGDSQDAQRESQILDSIEPFTVSQSTSADIIDQQNQPQPALSGVIKESSVALDESPSSPASKHQASPGKSQIMDSQDTGGATSDHSLSARHELSRLFGLVTDSDPIVESSNDKSNFESAESASESVPQLQSQAEIPIHASLGLDTQSVDAGPALWNPDAAGSNPEFAVESIAPLDMLSQPPQSATDALLGMAEMSFPTPSSRVTDLQTLHHTPEIQHATVSPADITRQDESDQADVPPMASLLLEETVPPKLFESSQADQAQSDHDSTESPSSHQELARDYIVTLPFQASLRPIYDDILMEYKRPITNFSNAFSGEIYVEPPESLVSKIDELFGRLYNLCDFPRDVIGSPLEEISPKDIAKYCCDANSKFSFVFEVLQNLQKDTKVLIIARSPELLRLIHHLTDALQLQCKCDAIGKQKSEFEHSTVQVVLATASETIDSSDFDIVIGFDSSFQTSQLMLQSPSRQGSIKPQLVLMLVITHSIEHIGLQISETPEDMDLNEIEQKNVLIAAIVRMRKLLNDPDRNYLEPHQIAALFCKFLNGEESIIPWEPQAVPDEVLDVFYSSQTRSQMPMVSPTEQENGRKRKLESADDSEVKRLRILSAQELEYDVKANQPPLPDDVRDLFEAATLKQKSARPEVMVQVPLSLLEVFAQQASEYERRIKDANLDAEYKATITNLENRIKEYERTTRKIYDTNRAALEDRSRFEAEAQKAETALKAAAETAEKEAGIFQKKIAGLEETISRLTQDPDSANPEETPLAKNEGLLQEALARIAVLEKRLENNKEDGSYVRNAYQEATSAAAAMKVELDMLQEQNQELNRKASENAVQIQRIQAQNTVTIYVRQIGELKAQMKERETELDRAREELRQLKNGRRETRGVSVPHSPRMGLMSPRIGRGYGSASRGTSPAPGAGGEGASTQHNGQIPSNSRWNHLRE